jgi:hypothetical protein
MKAVCSVVLVAMVAIFILSASCCSETQAQSSDEVLTCGVGVKGQTAAVRSSAGFTVVLTMSADDDHGKNSHQCEAEYSLDITRPDGASSAFRFFSSDDQWDRPLGFRVEGFSQDGKHVFIFISEGSYPADITVGEYDITSSPPPGGWVNEVKGAMLAAPFTRRLSRNCAATLHIIGTTPVGYIALGTEAKDGCASVERWQLTHNKRVMRGNLPAEVANNHPAHLPLHTAVTKLEAGVPVETQ